MKYRHLFVSIPVLLAPIMAQADTCMDLDENFNIIEFDCSDASNFSVSHNNTSVNIDVVLKASIGVHQRESIRTWDDYSPFIGNPEGTVKNFNTDKPIQGAVGLRVSKDDSGWFHEIDLSMVRFTNLKTHWSTYSSDSKFDATGALLSYSLGYDISKWFGLYASMGIGYVKLKETGFQVEYIDYYGNKFYDEFIEMSDIVNWAKLSLGTEVGILSWLKLYGEYTYITDLGNDDYFGGYGNFINKTFFTGVKLIF